MSKLSEEIKKLRLEIEEVNRRLMAIDEFCGLLYEEKYGAKKELWSQNLFDVEKIPEKKTFAQ